MINKAGTTEWGWRYGMGLALRNGAGATEWGWRYGMSDNPHSQQNAMITQHLDYAQPLIANSCEQVIDRQIV